MIIFRSLTFNFWKAWRDRKRCFLLSCLAGKKLSEKLTIFRVTWKKVIEWRLVLYRPSYMTINFIWSFFWEGTYLKIETVHKVKSISWEKLYVCKTLHLLVNFSILTHCQKICRKLLALGFPEENFKSVRDTERK